MTPNETAEKTFPNHKGHPEHEIELKSSWMLISKTHLYLGAVLVFLVGMLSGGGYYYRASMDLAQSLGATAVTQPSNGHSTVLVTGGLGFIGSHVVEDLVANDFNVVVYDDMSNGKNFNKDVSAVLVKDITVVNDFSYIVHKIDYVVHLAAAISVEESTRLPEKYQRINVEGSRKVLDWAVKNGVKRVVAASSGATYGTPKVEDLPLREESATGGICAYATTKFDMEHLMAQFHEQSGLKSTALRFFNVYGPRQDPHSSYSGVVSWFMEQAKINGTLKVTGDGDQYRDFVYVKDVARAIRTAMLLQHDDFDVFNVCTGVKTSINDVAVAVKAKFGSSADISHIPYRQGDVKESVCSPVKAATKLGFTASYDFPTGIGETRDWFMTI
uniref:NAD-dependent epimerase/dehydratase domain-containing protein n=1 Tax=Phytophthora ramorum TaxID=164328 RepID=H3GCE4_PHYRM